MNNEIHLALEQLKASLSNIDDWANLIRDNQKAASTAIKQANQTLHDLDHHVKRVFELLELVSLEQKKDIEYVLSNLSEEIQNYKKLFSEYNDIIENLRGLNIIPQLEKIQFANQGFGTSLGELIVDVREIQKLLTTLQTGEKFRAILDELKSSIAKQEKILDTTVIVNGRLNEIEGALTNLIGQILQTQNDLKKVIGENFSRMTDTNLGFKKEITRKLDEANSTIQSHITNEINQIRSFAKEENKNLVSQLEEKLETYTNRWIFTVIIAFSFVLLGVLIIVTQFV